MAPFSVSRSGVLSYFEEPEAAPGRLTWFDRSGKTIETFGPSIERGAISLSPDGARVAMEAFDPRTGTIDLWLYDFARGANSRLTFDPGNDYSPIWSPDGRQVVFSGNRKGWGNLYLMDADGATAERLLLDSGGESVPVDWSPDGHFVLYTDRQPNGRQNLWALPMTGERRPIPVKQDQFDEGEGRFSPDGRWIAYTSDETGRNEVYLTSFPRAEHHVQISTMGGRHPTWRRDGRELVYVSVDREILAVGIKTEPRVSASVPRPLFRLPADSEYDMTSDGQRFLVNISPEVSGTSSITVVFDWLPGKQR